MHCQGTASSSNQGLGYLIAYGVKGSQSNVDSDVHDTVYVVENGKMSLQTNLDINGYEIKNAKLGDDLNLNNKNIINIGGNLNMNNHLINTFKHHYFLIQIVLLMLIT